MYLITRPKAEAEQLIALLNSYQIMADYLPIMEIVAHDIDFNWLQQILVDFDSLFFVSPTAIKLANQLITKLDKNKKIIVPGNASKKAIISINSNLNILCPEHASGIDAVINEDLLINTRNILIFGGDDVNKKLVQFARLDNINLRFINLYTRLNVLKLRLEEICQQIVNTRVEGIVITSKYIANWLQPVIADSRVNKKITSITFISIHPQITKILKQYKINVVETTHSDNLSVLKLIRELNND